MLDAVEVGGLRCTGRCLPLRAFENRVYEGERGAGEADCPLTRAGD
ncbi:MAG: hypothetical protein HYU25_17710 [Candidatus Rokubacteria bacterium]|nr:hypothetical protein [Candidatus Rokubacteria bacterium]